MAVRFEDLSRGAQRGILSTTRGGPVTFLDEPEPDELFCPVISVDDHYCEPATVMDRVPARFRDAAPHMIENDEGVPYWVLDDTRFPIIGNRPGRPVAEWTLAPQKWDEMRAGVYDVHARVHDMDLNGVWASLNFPSIPWGFAGWRLARLRDLDAGLAALRSYNDWVLEDWCGAYPDRFIPCQIPWLADPALAAAEIRRNAARGFKTVSFSENPEGLGYPSVYTDHWDPFFAACEETGTVVNLHTGSSSHISVPSTDSAPEVSNALFPVNAITACVDWIFAKVPIRFPELKLVLSEGGCSWVPMVVERLTRAYRLREASPTWLASDPHPVDVLRRNFWFTSIEDPSAFRLLDIIGSDRIMLETDYPHSDGSWPSSQSLFREGLGGLPTEVVRDLCYRTASEVYDHPGPPAELIERSVIGA